MQEITLERKIIQNELENSNKKYHKIKNSYDILQNNLNEYESITSIQIDTIKT